MSRITVSFCCFLNLDFGFARFADTESLLKTICGSFIYAAPELVAGRSEYSGFLTDCWSLGVILYCMLCRKLPFAKEELMQMARGHILLRELEFPLHVSYGNFFVEYLKVYGCFHTAKLFIKNILGSYPLKRLAIGKISLK